MADVTLPQLGETVTEGTITRWFKKVGDTIAADEALFEVSTDKVDTEVPAPVAGVVLEIRAAEGDTVLSPQLARSMLEEVRKIDQPRTPEEDRVVTKREEEVLQLIADGCSTPEVAARLYISQKTVENHLASIYQKLDARDRTQAVLQAVRMGIVSLD